MRATILDDGKITQTRSFDAVRAAHAGGKKIWVDLEDRSPENEALLASTFKLHSLVAEDIWSDRSHPKIDEFDDYLYIVVHGISRASAPTKVGLWVFDLVIGKTFVITQCSGDTSAADALAKKLERSPRLLEKGPPWIAHAVLDWIVDRYLPLIVSLGEQIDDVERHVVERAGTPTGKDLLPVIFALKRSIFRLSRITQHQREILLRLSRNEFEEIPKTASPYFRDIYDHFVRVAETTDMDRDVIVNAMDAYLSVQSNRMNETVKTLTLMSTVMLPMNFLASFYGMNFHYMPELQWRYGYPFVISLMIFVASSIIVVFKLKKWA